MKATAKLHDLGQSLWLDNITRDLLESGTLARYIAELSVTGLTSNPTIFDHAIKGSADYDAAIRSKLKAGKSGEALFFELALEDITRAADLFRPIYERTRGVDGWVSLEVSPLLAYDTKTTLAVAKDLHARAGRPNLFIKIPGTKEGLPGDRGGDLRRRAGQRDAALLARALRRRGRGVPARHRAAHRRGPVARRRRRSRRCSSAAGTSRSRARCRRALVNKLGIAIGQRSYKAYCDLVASPRYRRVMNEGGRPQRLLFASTGTKDPEGVRHPVRRGAGRAVHRQHDAREDAARHRRPRRRSARRRPPTAATARRCSAQFKQAGVDIDALAAKLQTEGADSFVKSWNELMGVLASKSALLKAA